MIELYCKYCDREFEAKASRPTCPFCGSVGVERRSAFWHYPKGVSSNEEVLPAVPAAGDQRRALE